MYKFFVFLIFLSSTYLSAQKASRYCIGEAGDTLITSENTVHFWENYFEYSTGVAYTGPMEIHYYNLQTNKIHRMTSMKIVDGVAKGYQYYYDYLYTYSDSSYFKRAYIKKDEYYRVYYSNKLSYEKYDKKILLFSYLFSGERIYSSFSIHVKDKYILVKTTLDKKKKKYKVSTFSRVKEIVYPHIHSQEFLDLIDSEMNQNAHFSSVVRYRSGG